MRMHSSTSAPHMWGSERSRTMLAGGELRDRDIHRGRHKDCSQRSKADTTRLAIQSKQMSYQTVECQKAAYDVPEASRSVRRPKADRFRLSSPFEGFSSERPW